jgi:hypothetical protein
MRLNRGAAENAERGKYAQEEKAKKAEFWFYILCFELLSEL